MYQLDMFERAFVGAIALGVTVESVLSAHDSGVISLLQGGLLDLGRVDVEGEGTVGGGAFIILVLFAGQVDVAELLGLQASLERLNHVSAVAQLRLTVLIEEVILEAFQALTNRLPESILYFARVGAVDALDLNLSDFIVLHETHHVVGIAVGLVFVEVIGHVVVLAEASDFLSGCGGVGVDDDVCFLFSIHYGHGVGVRGHVLLGAHLDLQVVQERVGSRGLILQKVVIYGRGDLLVEVVVLGLAHLLFGSQALQVLLVLSEQLVVLLQGQSVEFIDFGAEFLAVAAVAHGGE